MTTDSPYFQFNREERNHAAILYHLLLTGTENLKTFLNLLGQPETDVSSCELYFEYAFLRDMWHNMPETQKREWILSKLPSLRKELTEAKTTAEWNSFFEVRTKRASQDKIQSPANWVTKRIKGLNDDEIKEVNELKWCFNLKPDLVIKKTNGDVICIEAKLESKQDKYTCALNGDAGIAHSIGQLKCQQLMFTKMLGLEEKRIHPFLLVRGNSRPKGKDILTWEEVFAAMDKTGSHPFVAEWINRNEVYGSKLARRGTTK